MPGHHGCKMFCPHNSASMKENIPIGSMNGTSNLATNGPAAKKPRVELKLHKQHSVCLVLDYGSQYTQLIARRVRAENVYSMILPGDATLVRYIH